MPTGFLRWNSLPFNVPHYIYVESTSQFSGHDTWKDILLQKRTFIHPINSDKTMCTALLLGYPRKNNMEFISVPCDRKLPMAGIACMYRNITNIDKLTYGITHVQAEPLYHFSYSADIRLFNLERFNTDSLNASNSHMLTLNGSRDTISDLRYFETLSKAQYNTISKQFHKEFKWPWIENRMQCNNPMCDFSLDESIPFCQYASQNRCECLIQICSQLGEPSPLSRGLRTLTKYVILPFFLSGNTSVVLTGNTGNTLTAVKECENSWMAFLGQCVKLVKGWNKDNRVSTMHRMCNVSGQGESEPFVLHNIQTQKMFDSWNLGERRITFLDSVHQCVTYYSTKVPLESTITKCHDEEQKQHKQHPYIMCSRNMTHTTCPAGYILCRNECVSKLLWCDGQIDCPGVVGKIDCQQICVSSFSTDLEFCLKDCHRDNCTCNTLFFQCESGGCISSAKLCDWVLDCSDGSDEKLVCPIEMYSITVRQHVKSLQNTRESLANVSKQHHDVQSLETSWLHSMAKCDPTFELPCLHWNPECYPVDKICVYDHTSEGHLKYCRNGQHLLGCEEAQCSGTYKCRQSYCVSTQKVCDGVIDCPYGDDEFACPIHTCGSMLHCGTRCVHPKDICDGVNDCEDGTDEQFCHPSECPNMCDCLGHSVRCVGSDVGKVSRLTGIVKIAIIRSNKYFVLNHNSFSNMSFTLFLDLVNNSLTRIDMLNKFPSLKSVIKLNISRNRIAYVDYSPFSTLSNLRKLDLSRNPIIELIGRVFVGLNSLTHLYLHHSKLDFVSELVFTDIHHINILDISSSVIRKLSHICFNGTFVDLLDLRGTLLTPSQARSNWCVRQVSIVLSDQKGVCCLNVFQRKCSLTYGHIWDCRPLLVNSVYAYCLYTATIFTFLSNGVSLLFNLHVTGPDSGLVANLALANMIMTIPIYAVAQWNSDYGTEISFYEAFINDNAWCSISGVMLIVSSQVGSMTILLIAVIRCYGVLSMQSRLHSKRMQFNIAAFSVWVCWIGTSVAFALLKRNSGIHEISECLIPRKGNMTVLVFLIICASSNAICCLIHVSLSVLLMREVLKSSNIGLGRKYGGVQVTFLFNRLLVTSLTTILALVLPSILFLLSSFDFQSGRTVVNTAVVVFMIQPVTNPLLYTFATRRFGDNWRTALMWYVAPK